ncbi:MAG: response regulator [Desulfamplus sp.]|nr:response regulator [Desulfamplus sp.]
MFLPKITTSPTIEYLLAENLMFREEIKVAREASSITAKLVVKQFEETEKMLRKFQIANAERQAVLDAATQLSIIAADLNGTITLFSPGATTLLGYSAEEMVGKLNISSLHIKDEIQSHGQKLTGSKVEFTPIQVFDQYVKQKISQSSDWTYIKKDGSHLPINLSITPFYNVTGSLKGYLFTAMDMSSHKLMEKELIEAMKNAESANASKGDFLARMSHEIRTPMNGVLGMAHLLKKTELSPKQSNYIDKILSSANTLLNLINDILDFSKIDAGKLEIESIPFDLEDVLSHLINSIGLNAEEKGLEFVFQIDQRVPFNLVGDPLRLGQVLTNLASNAVKFTEYGEIIISVSVDDFSENNSVDGLNKNYEDLDGHYVTLQFSIQDSGIGLYPEQIDSLFDAFSQADDSITRKYGGTGLGLSICRQLTEMMGGKIWVESSPGKGSNFIFTSRFKLYKEGVRRSALKNSFKGLHALVVDDNETARYVLKNMLESFKINVDTANDGNHAIEMLQDSFRNGNPYDVVLLDWIMPGIDGIETARRIRDNPEFAKIPAMLMVTANGREEARVEAERAGLEGFLLKPVYASVMYNTLLEMLGIDHHTSWQKKSREEDFKSANAMKGLNGALILLVEDNPINQEVAAEFLKDAGIIVKIVSNGYEALNMVDKEPFDLILMDIQMPVMDGLEAARKIRNEKLMSDIPIIAMTAHAMAGDHEKSLNAGMNGHISKPVDPIELYNIIRQFIGDKNNLLSIDSNCYVESNSSVGEESTLFDRLSNSTLLDSKNNSKSLACFSDIQGIDYKTAIKRLNNKPEMLMSILNDFRKNYADEPDKIEELLREGNFKDIQMKAHTLKGVAGYMGAEELLQSASKLEDFLKQNEDVIVDKTYILIEALKQSIKQTLEYLSVLPSSYIQRSQSSDIQTEKNRDLPENRITDNQTLLKSNTYSSLDMLKKFMLLLRSGDATATDMFEEAQSILKHYGYNEELIIISELIDDIEYEAAGDIVEKIVQEFNINGKRERD